jgi:hypothetical protein
VDGRLRESAGQDLAGHIEAPGNNRREARHYAFDVSAFEEPADRVGVWRAPAHEVLVEDRHLAVED